MLASSDGVTYSICSFAGLAQLVARNLAKVEVAGSNPVARSMIFRPDLFGLFYTSSLARWPSGKAEACKAFILGSNPGLASRESKGRSQGRSPLFASLVVSFGE